MSVLLEAVAIKWGLLIAGFLGAVASLKFIPVLSVTQRGSTVIAGTLIAYYCTPLTIEVLGLSEKLGGPIAFLGGLFGMSIAGACIKAMPELVEAARKKVLGG